MAWLDTLTAWLAAHPHWLGLAVFLLAFGECLAIVGLLIPGTVLLFAVAVLAGNGALPLWETLLLGFVGGMLGDLCSYALGRRFHQNIRGLPVLRDHPQWLASAEQHFERYGVISLLAGRFIGPCAQCCPWSPACSTCRSAASPPSACWPAAVGPLPTCYPAGPPVPRCACHCRRTSGRTPRWSPGAWRCCWA